MTEQPLTIEQIIENEMTPRTVRFWGNDYENFVPVLAEKQHGDGKRLMWFSSMDTRPNYYLIRVDSGLLAGDSEEEIKDNIRDFVDQTLIEALEDEFGCWSEESEDEDEYPGFPVVCLETGFFWRFFDEFGCDF